MCVFTQIEQFLCEHGFKNLPERVQLTYSKQDIKHEYFDVTLLSGVNVVCYTYKGYDEVDYNEYSTTVPTFEYFVETYNKLYNF